MDIKNNRTIINDESNNDNSGDNRGKFSDRIKKIRRDRLMRKKNINLDEEEHILKTSGRNIFKVILALPSVVYTNIKSNKGNSVRKHTVSINANEEIQVGEVRRIKVSKIRDMDVSLLRRKKEIYSKDNSKTMSLNIESEEIFKDEIKIANLQKEILALIKKRLVKSVNELEVLQSELYVLSELDGNSVYLKDCQENIKQIRKLLSKVKALKEKYDYLKDNVDFEYMLEFGDDFLVDKILELKDLCSKDEVSYVIDNYKILDEYKYLYLKIDKLYENSVELEKYRDKRVEELKERDIDFDRLKQDVYDIDREKERYNNFVLKQEAFLNELEEKISQIDSHEEVRYRLKGFNELLGNGFKYLGLLLVNPLKGLVPGIVTQTLVTKNIVHNLYKNLRWEEQRKLVYEAVDYSNTLNSAINSLDNTTILINSTLEEIVGLKNDYKAKFSKYENEVPGYKDTIRKINKMQNAILGSKIKLDLMKQRLKEKEMQNKNKFKLVRKLNDSANTSTNS